MTSQELPQSAEQFRDCYTLNLRDVTDGNGPEVFTQCSTGWIRNDDLSKDDWGDYQLNRSSTLFNRGVPDNMGTSWL